MLAGPNPFHGTNSSLDVLSGFTGGAVSFTDTYSNATFSSLGLTPGSYTWSWSSDSVVLNIGALVGARADVGVVDDRGTRLLPDRPGLEETGGLEASALMRWGRSARGRGAWLGDGTSTQLVINPSGDTGFQPYEAAGALTFTLDSAINDPNQTTVAFLNATGTLTVSSRHRFSHTQSAPTCNFSAAT